MTRVPVAPAYVRGLINMRGTIVTVLDLAVRLDPSRPQTTDGSILLLRYRDRLVGLVVEQVVDLRAMTTMGDEPVVVLDLEVLIKQVLLS